MKPDHFEKTYYYIAGVTFVILVYVFAITFFEIPEKNQRFVDIALAFLLGLISGLGAYLTGGNPQSITKKPIDGTTTAEVNITATTETNNVPKN